jgi:hypothetical protein
MATEYPVNIELTLRPVFHQDPPVINLGINNDLKTIILHKQETFQFEYVTGEKSKIIVEFLNKSDVDSIPYSGLDKAVVIESISFFGISDPRFVWTGEYCPEYPEPWYSSQEIKPEPLLKNHTYLGWNGKWTLTFTVPVFTWIHRVQNLGWIYD